MRVKVHLISAPWATPLIPSLQAGCIKAYLDQLQLDDLETVVYPAHFEILYRMKASLCLDFFNRFCTHGELPYFLLYCRRYLATQMDTDGMEIKEILKRKENLKTLEPITEAHLDYLDRATQGYLNDVVLPQILSNDGVNVVGFPLNFHQIYASIYMERLIQESVSKKTNLLFLYGGYCASSPVGVMTLRELNAQGLRVIGEGEKKIEKLVKLLLMAKEMPPAIGNSVKGILPVFGSDQFIFESETDILDEQIVDLAELPLPDFHSYFSGYRQHEPGDPILSRALRPQLVMEGTRGCFAHCDFCTLNSQWKGFRKLRAEEVFQRAVALSRKYGASYIHFADNVCDTWAEKFADLILESGEKLQFFMELRVHHRERFWVKLALAGLDHVQIGVEALSQPLLTKMGKGTLVIQNLRVHKLLKELEIWVDSNLITDHPKSTVEDVNETRCVLESLDHLDSFHLSPFFLDAKSPFFESLPKEERLTLPLSLISPLPPPLNRFIIDHRGFEIPKRLAPSQEVNRAWKQFKKSYSELSLSKPPHHSGTLSVASIGPGQIIIKDNRFSDARELIFEGQKAGIYDLCHQGMTLSQLSKVIEMPSGEILEFLNFLVEKKLILKTGSYYLSLALRSREELIATFGSQSHS